MNLSQLVGTIFRGMEQQQQGQPLQLKPGQIVRAQILAMLSNEEALLQIGDLRIVGKLEANLTVGETAWLQVQNRLATGQLQLKTILPDFANQTSSGSIEQLTVALGLKNTATNNELIQTLVQQQVPLSKEKAKLFEAILNRLLPNGTKDTPQFKAIVTAFAVADQKNLPITEQSIKAIVEFMSKEPLDQKLSAVMKEIDQVLTKRELPAPLLSKMVTLKNEITSLFVPIVHNEESIAFMNNSKLSSFHQPIQSNQLNTATGNQNNEGTTMTRNSPLINQNQVVSSESSFEPIVQKNEINTSRSVTPTVSQTADQQPRIGQPLSDVVQQIRSNLPVQIAETSPNATSQKIVDSLRTMGLEHEHQLKQLSKTSLNEADFYLLKEQTVKSLILSLQQDQLTASPALREAVEKVVNHITGQQLMFTPAQQSDQVFSQIMMQIPIEVQGQKSTASIQIEWKDQKNGGKKQVDLENCRMFFNLSMSNMGLTFVDVQIVNRIISVKIFNDVPNIKEQFAPFISTLQENVEALGYRFSGLSYTPIPDSNDKRSQGKTYVVSDYKGVDFRI